MAEQEVLARIHTLEHSTGLSVVSRTEFTTRYIASSIHRVNDLFTSRELYAYLHDVWLMQLSMSRRYNTYKSSPKYVQDT